jgi:outer membrane PBP1 activator LpoA protein
MQRQSACSLLVLALLYLAACSLANHAVQAQQHEGPNATLSSGPHIAVLLPIKSPAVGRQADAVRLGILEAAKVHRGTTLPLVVYATSDESFDVVEAYERAMRSGAQLVIGPLTRSAVTALAATQLVNVPTLALSAPDADSLLPQNLFIFGLQVENEAKQVAQLSREKGRRALIIAGESALSRRLAQAYADEFARRGGSVVDQFQFTNDAPALIKLRDSIAAGISDVIFLALDAQRAHQVRSYLGGAQAIFATSLVYVSADPLANHELNGVYFVDMPWLLSPDHPAVLAYARQPQSSLEFQRFYALGIDAYRLAQDLLKANIGRATLDGVTGTISPSREHRFVRESVPAQFNQGETRTLSDTLGRPRG